MARKKTTNALILINTSLSIIFLAGVLSTTYGCSDLIPTTSIEENTTYNDKLGWHLVNDVNQLKDGDQVILVGQDSYDNFYIMDDDFKGVLADYSLDAVSKNGFFTLYNSTVSLFTIKKDNDDYLFKNTQGYLASNNVLSYAGINGATNFNLSFVENKALLKDKNNNLINFKNNSFISALSNNVSYPYIFKWFGKEEITFAYSVNYKYMYDFTEYNLVSDHNYKLQDGDVVCPVLYVNDDYYVPTNVTLPACQECNMITEINYYGYGLGSNDFEFSFFEVNYGSDGFFNLISVEDAYYDPLYDGVENIRIKYYKDDSIAWQDNNYHSSNLAYSIDGDLLGELGFYICPDLISDTIKYCHFGASSLGIDGDFDRDGLYGSYGQINYWLVLR